VCRFPSYRSTALLPVPVSDNVLPLVIVVPPVKVKDGRRPAFAD
jgi:hypothetical protein